MVDKPASRSRPPKLLDQMREALRSRHYSRRTEQTYCQWVKRCIHFHHVRHPAEMAEPEIDAFLTHLTVKEKVSASTQNQALSALLLLYRHVLGREVGDLGKVIRARKATRLPVVMTRDEVKAVLANLSGDKWLMASLMYGAGLRLMECLRLRVQDIDFSRNEIIVRDGKGAKDRVTMLPESLKAPLLEHLKRVKSIHERDFGDGWGSVPMPDALDRKYPNAPTEWRRQWVFPQENRWRNAKTGEEGRHHVDESLVQKAVRTAVARAGLLKRATCHTLPAFLRHPFALRRLRHPNGPRTAGAQGCQDDHDLHTCPQPWAIRRTEFCGRTLRGVLCRSA
jgi:integron integrase